MLFAPHHRNKTAQLRTPLRIFSLAFIISQYGVEPVLNFFDSHIKKTINKAHGLIPTSQLHQASIHEHNSNPTSMRVLSHDMIDPIYVRIKFEHHCID